uniref:Endonuclease n=1 Tax=viral metagenome TaxID=1070528 RepID=A0A6M3XQ55_9ZZZZ
MSEPREKRYAAEYMAENFAAGTYATNIPLGEIPRELVDMHGPGQAAAIYRPSRRRIDAVAWSPGKYLLIEFKIRDPFEGLSRLPTYLRLARRTDDLPGYNGQPFEMWLIVPFALEWIRHDAGDAGIVLKEYWREWIAAYIEQYQGYFTKEYQARRAEKKRIRQALGVE